MMFVVEVGAAVTTVFLARDIATGAGEIGFTSQIVIWLWFTVLFANFAEAMAEAALPRQRRRIRSARLKPTRMPNASAMAKPPGLVGATRAAD